MGMGYGANYADVISKETIIKICGEVATDFFNWFENRENKEGLLDQFAMRVFWDYDDFADEVEEKELERLDTLYECLIEDFKQRTGLDLELQYHSRDDGDRYDEIVDSYWAVYNVYEMTPEAKRLVDNGINIERKFYVTFG